MVVQSRWAWYHTSKKAYQRSHNERRNKHDCTPPRKNACEAYNRAVVCVIAGLTIDEAEALSAAIIHEKNNLAPNARGTIATGKEQNIARMLGDGHNNALPQQKKKKKKKKKKNKNKSAGKTTAPDTKKQG